MNITYPGIFSFQVSLDKEKCERKVFAMQIKSKAKLENKKFTDVKSSFWTSDIQCAVIEVLEIENEEQLTMKLHELSEWWATV